MKMITTHQEFENAGYLDLITLECKYCKNEFKVTKHRVHAIIRDSKISGFKKNRNTGNYCSRKCCAHDKKNGQIYKCFNCDKEFYSSPSLIFKSCKRVDNNKIFCSHSCAGKYWSTHKIYGVSRSKFEEWIEQNLTNLYPNLHIEYNYNKAIDAELDIFIPSLKLGFELNGKFHYVPVFSQETLDKTKVMDSLKYERCIEKKIEFCVIDTTSMKSFSKKKGKIFLKIITDLIDLKLKNLLLNVPL